MQVNLGINSIGKNSIIQYSPHVMAYIGRSPFEVMVCETIPIKI